MDVMMTTSGCVSLVTEFHHQQMDSIRLVSEGNGIMQLQNEMTNMMMTILHAYAFSIADPSLGKSTHHRWIRLTKGQ